MENFKSYESLLIEDDRWQYFCQFETAPIRVPITLQYIYDNIATINLSDHVPDEIKGQFNIAKMLAVYSWLYDPFHQASELKAYSTLEYALRQKYKVRGLNNLLKRSVEDGIVKRIDYPELLSYMRNDLAHGSTTLHPDSDRTLRTCTNIINELFRPKDINI